ncbi:MAG: hypothetical protein EOP49_33595 [Sphingobacteriales bacterium]|nr:MAG: hypothetical protein EOP49_33595 [Sphingobacteriales bacterium]
MKVFIEVPHKGSIAPSLVGGVGNFTVITAYKSDYNAVLFGLFCVLPLFKLNNNGGTMVFRVLPS